MLLEVLTAVRTLFNQSGATSSLFPNLYLSLAPDLKEFPRCVLTVVNSTPTYNTGNTAVTSVGVQFSVFTDANTEEGGDIQALSGIAAIKGVFDFSSLTFGGGVTNVVVMRTNEGLMREDEQTWHAFVEYQIEVNEPLPARS